VNQYSTEVVDIVNTILHEKFEVATAALTAEANLKEDLKLDSLDFVDMFIILEQKTGSDVQNVDFMNIRTLGDIYKLVSELSIQRPAN
jgi:acyl carrier protein